MDKKEYIVEVIENGKTFDVRFLNKKNKHINHRLSLDEFSTYGEVKHYLQHVPKSNKEVVDKVVLYLNKNDFNPQIDFDLINSLRQ